MSTLPAPLQSALNALFPSKGALTSHQTAVDRETLANIARLASEHKISPDEAADLVERQREETLAALATDVSARDVDTAKLYAALKDVIVAVAGAAL